MACSLQGPISFKMSVPDCLAKTVDHIPTFSSGTTLRSHSSMRCWLAKVVMTNYHFPQAFKNFKFELAARRRVNM